MRQAREASGLAAHLRLRHLLYAGTGTTLKVAQSLGRRVIWRGSAGPPRPLSGGGPAHGVDAERRYPPPRLLTMTDSRAAALGGLMPKIGSQATKTNSPAPPICPTAATYGRPGARRSTKNCPIQSTAATISRMPTRSGN